MWYVHAISTMITYEANIYFAVNETSWLNHHPKLPCTLCSKKCPFLIFWITLLKKLHMYTHTCLTAFFAGTTQVSRYQKGKTNLDFTEARDSDRQWHQLGHMQVCTSLQTDNHASTPPLSFFTGRMPFLPPNQQCQSTKGQKLTD